MRRVAAIEGRNTGKTGQRHILAAGIDLDGVVLELGTQNLRHAGQMIVAGRRNFERRTVGA
ncbi:hypothetical protein D3C86_1330330 [compost metagenome]